MTSKLLNFRLAYFHHHSYFIFIRIFAWQSFDFFPPSFFQEAIWSDFLWTPEWWSMTQYFGLYWGHVLFPDPWVWLECMSSAIKTVSFYFLFMFIFIPTCRFSSFAWVFFDYNICSQNQIFSVKRLKYSAFFLFFYSRKCRHFTTLCSFYRIFPFCAIFFSSLRKIPELIYRFIV